MTSELEPVEASRVVHEDEERRVERSPPPSYSNFNSMMKTLAQVPEDQEDEDEDEQVESDSGEPISREKRDAESDRSTPVQSNARAIESPQFTAEMVTRDSSSEITTIPNNAVMNMSARTAKRENNVSLEEILERYEIGGEFADKLESLRDFKIVFILDDSSSMKHLLQESPLLKLQPRVARWNELQYFANIALQLANFYDESGCDVHFLNKEPGLKNCKSLIELNNFFKQTKPKGFTPLTSKLKSVLDEYADLTSSGHKLLTIIVTDGEPTDIKGNSDIKGFRKCLKSRPGTVFTTIVACTDQNDSIRYLNRMDRQIRQVDVLDDYRSEKEEVRKARGRRFRFTYGDYVCKALIGAIDRKTDRIDEKNRLKSACKIS